MAVQQAYVAAKTYARSKGPIDPTDTAGYHPLPDELPTVLSRSLYGSHVLSTFFGPVLGAMMKQVCWHSRRSEAHRGLPEARPRTQKRNGTRTKRGSRGLESI